ncbi:MAG: LacI family transcriptional regulator [Verrucomicrobia bacterium]|nr:LacI family transcriptional regulator [Verrucomicrobiota bacterium]
MPRGNTASDTASGASIYDVAEKAGVSIVTVSRVFNDYPHVSTKMRDRVLAAARDVGYTPRLVSKPKILAVIVGHLEYLTAGDYKTRLILQLVRESSKHGYLIEFIPHSSAYLATKSLVDGVIEIGLTEEETAMLDLPPVPTVLVNKRAEDVTHSTVCSDHYREAKVATEYLLEKGHSRIALVLDELKGWGVENRASGYRDTLLNASVDSEPLIFSAEDSPASEVTDQIITAKCTAALLLTDNAGLEIVDCLTNVKGLRIPDDISVITIENKSASAFFNPRLTTIDQPLKDIAADIVKEISAAGDEQGRIFHHVFESRLIKRDSVSTVTS